MSGPRDEELVTMLEARADRLQGSVAREVMAAVREEIRRPRGGALFSVVPVTRARGMNRPAGWAAIGLAAALVLAVVGGGRLNPGPSTPAGTGPGSGSPAPSRDATGGPAATAMAPAATTITVAELRAGLNEGSLNGRVVLLTGSLRVSELPCFGPAACRSMEIVGLEGVGVSVGSGTMSAEDVLAGVNAHPGNSLMAFRVHVSDLVLLGWPGFGVSWPVTVTQLAQGIEGLTGDDLAIVSGSLGRWLPSCRLGFGGVQRCFDDPGLTDAVPTTGGELPVGGAGIMGVAVADAVGLEAVTTDQPWLRGPFLVRHLAVLGVDSPEYEVIARLDPATTVQVVTENGAAALTVEQFRAAVEDGSMDGRLVAVTGWLQRSGGMCPADLPQPCTPYVILGLGDVPITWDGTMPLITFEPAQRPSPAPATLVLTPRDGRLLLLGRLIGSLEQPATIEELTEGRLLSRGMDALALTTVAGWLVAGGIQSCRAPGPDRTPCPGPGPLLTDVEPSPDGRMTNVVRQQSVRVWPGAVGIDPEQVVTPGPFLYRIAEGSTCDGLDRREGWACAGGPTWSWEVMARYDIGRVQRVVVP